MSLKWENVKENLLQSSDKAEFVHDLLSKYASSSAKYLPAFHYLGKELVKHAHRELTSLELKSRDLTSLDNVTQWVSVVSPVVEHLADDRGVRDFINKIAPHLVVATAKLDAPADLYSLADVLYPLISQYSKQSSNSHIYINLMKAGKALRDQEDDQDITLQSKLFVQGLHYLLLCPDSDNIGPSGALVVRGMSLSERRYFRESLLDILDTCLTQDIGVVKLAELLFLVAGDCSDTTRTHQLISSYRSRLSNPGVLSVIDIALKLSGDEDEDIVIPTSISSVFSNKDNIPILLAVSRFVCTLLLKYSDITLSLLPLIREVCKLLLRSPQQTLNEHAVSLLSHLHHHVDLAKSTENPFLAYSPLLQLHVSAFNKPGINHGLTPDEFRAHLRRVCVHIPDVTQQIQCLNLGTQVPDVTEWYLMELAAVLRSNGHLTDVIELLSGAEQTESVKLYLAVCHVSLLEVEQALVLLEQIHPDDASARSKVSILLVYCNFISTLKKNEDFSLPDPIIFCEDAHDLLSSPHDDCLLSITMFLGGLYGLHTITSACAARLTHTPHTSVSLLAAVPALLATETRVEEGVLGTLVGAGSSVEEVERVIHTAEFESGSRDLLTSVCHYVMLDKLLDSGCDVYRAAEECLKYCLEAAFTKLKSWKRTKMSIRALLWKNCCVLPYLLHVLERYLKFLFTWGTLNYLALSYLDRFYQLAKFLRSDYWLTKHHNMVLQLQITLSYPFKIPEPLRQKTTKPRSSNPFTSAYLHLEEYLVSETQIISYEISRRLENTSCPPPPCIPTGVPPRYHLELALLRLTLAWGGVSDPLTQLSDMYPALKQTKCGGYLPTEIRILSEAWLELLGTYQSSVPSKPRRGGRSTRRQGRNVDHVTAGLTACAGLHPVLVTRELLRRRMKGATLTWGDIELYHNISLQHQLHYAVGAITPHSTPDLPDNWTIASITKIDNTIFIGQRSSDTHVLFKRELPFTMRSMPGLGSDSSCVEEMERIIQSNDDSILHVNDKIEFWKSRYQLDSSLEKLLVKLETDWLGPWRGLLFGKPSVEGYTEDVKQSAVQLRKKLKSKFKVTLDKFLSEYILDCYSILTEDDISAILPDICITPAMLDLIHDHAPAAPPSRHPTLLCLDHDTAPLPWEACQVFKNQPIARVPCPQFALSVLMLRSLPVTLDKKETYYILNPRNDLPSTQALFEEWLEGQEWRGISAKPPSLAEYQTALSSDLFLYLGHGSGKEFLRGKSIQEFESKAVAMLMGCSSGQVKYSDLGIRGTPVEYLLSGCPAVVGYMWNVTDRDCDRFSKRLLELWLSDDTAPLVSLINPSREACKLRYLVGAAPVLYGVPDILTGS